MEFTGERFHPDCVREIWYEHWHRYVFTLPLVAGREVLDLACGEGYGSHLMAETASRVVGMDVASEAVEQAQEQYQRDNLSYRQGSATSIPFDSDSFDVVVSFETIEHLAEQAEMLAEFRRVLRPDGLLIISSPDKKTYSDDPGFVNEFHVRELYRDEFVELARQHFPALRLLGQKLMFQSVIWSLDEANSGCSWQAMNGGEVQPGRATYEPVYLIALCGADSECLPDTDAGLWLFGDQQESVYQHYNHEIKKNMHAGGLLAERDQQIQDLQQQLAKAEDSGSWLDRLLGRPARKQENHD
jgi:SAM-dependent methyltransferase